jgi:hypothetical protein
MSQKEEKHKIRILQEGEFSGDYSIFFVYAADLSELREILNEFDESFVGFQTESQGVGKSWRLSRSLDQASFEWLIEEEQFVSKYLVIR